MNADIIVSFIIIIGVAYMRGRILCCATSGRPEQTMNFPGFFVGFMMGLMQSIIIIMSVTELHFVFAYFMLEVVFYDVYDRSRF